MDWRCTSCGGTAVRVADSLDPEHPFGRCAEQTRPCQGLVPLTADRGELARVQTANRLGRARRIHRDHLGPRGHLVMTCTYCIAAVQRARGPVSVAP